MVAAADRLGSVSTHALSLSLLPVLVRRLHVDLMRLGTAGCRAAS